jgi:hypothetical protein
MAHALPAKVGRSTGCPSLPPSRRGWPRNGPPITATYREVYDAQIEHLVEEAGKHDLVVIGRARQKQGLAQGTLEKLIRECERPLLIPTKETPNLRVAAVSKLLSA